jgi:hypothetical protein
MDSRSPHLEWYGLDTQRPDGDPWRRPVSGGIHRIIVATGSIPPVGPRSVCHNEQGSAEVRAP